MPQLLPLHRPGRNARILGVLLQAVGIPEPSGAVCSIPGEAAHPPGQAQGVCEARTAEAE